MNAAAMSLPDLQPPAEATGDLALNDAALIDHALEIAAERHPDISPLVYARFFERCPEAQTLFRVVDPAQPPHGCGQMLFEIISLLQDGAAGRPHVPSYLQQVGHDHRGFGVHEAGFYADFLGALTDVVAQQLGGDWTPAHAQAWARQTESLLRHLR
jgi:hemoglobin-like flavoprotein